jgi:hypothetical protein
VSYEYEATVDGQYRDGEIGLGTYSTAIFFDSAFEYIAVRSNSDLYAGTLSMSYKLPQWNEGKIVSLAATVTNKAVALAVLGKNLLTYEVSISRAESFPGAGEPRKIYYAVSDQKDENGAFVISTDYLKDPKSCTINIGEDSVKFLPVKIIESDITYTMCEATVKPWNSK